MKRILLITVLSVFCTQIFGQTLEERQKIIQTYDQTKINTLKQALIEKNLAEKQEVDDYIARTGTPRTIKLDHGGVMKIRKILNDEPIYYSTDNVSEAVSTRTNFLQTGGGLGLNLDGQNMHVATWDGGPTLATHQEFQDNSPIPVSRVDNPDLSASNDQSDHSTHVSGTIIAKGTSAQAKGMAPEATLTSFDWDFDDQEALNEATTNGLLLSNHSYGIPMQTNPSFAWMMGCYDTEARTWDDVAFNAPYFLSVVSAGNDGSNTYTGGLAANYDKLVGNKNSKNNLVVANADNPLINPNGSGELLSMSINSGSSQGPSDDGRIKPDITADGTSVYSSISTSDTAYSTYNGTSMSAPNTTGTLLLLQQYYNQLNSKYMRAATLKGLACHTADESPSVPGPGPIFGWGLLNAKRAAETILGDTNNTALLVETSLSPGQTYTRTFNISGTSPLSATLCWTDPPGTAKDTQLNSPVPALVNDLDLRLTDSNSLVSLPWRLDLSNVVALAQKGDNLVDTVENIDIPAPVSGSYTLTVTHKGSLKDNLPQAFSIIVTGSDFTLSTRDNSLSEFFIWPNPANDIVNFKFNSVNNSKINVSLLDIQGREVFSNVISPNSSKITSSIETSSLSKGIYVLKINQGNAVMNKKVILQ
jgi:hypothetical protein